MPGRSGVEYRTDQLHSIDCFILCRYREPQWIQRSPRIHLVLRVLASLRIHSGDFSNFLHVSHAPTGQGMAVSTICWTLSFIGFAMIMSCAIWSFIDPLTSSASFVVGSIVSTISSIVNLAIVTAFCLQLRKHRVKDILEYPEINR